MTYRDRPVRKNRSTLPTAVQQLWSLSTHHNPSAPADGHTLHGPATGFDMTGPIGPVGAANCENPKGFSGHRNSSGVSRGAYQLGP